jgi:hypothetical protein
MYMAMRSTFLNALFGEIPVETVLAKTKYMKGRLQALTQPYMQGQISGLRRKTVKRV